VIGAGVNGLGIAWRLAQAGCEVDVYDAGTAGRGATWAAAGMLAAAAEAEPGESALVELGRESQAMWPMFADELQSASGIEPGYRETGLVVAAMNRDEGDKLAFDYRLQQDSGLDTRWLSRSDLHRLEPHLRTGAVAGIHSPNDHQADNRALSGALLAAARAAGAAVHEHTPVQEVEVAQGRARGVWVADTFVPAEAVVVAAGAWTSELAGVPDAARPPVRPIKGQMLSLRMDPQRPLVHHVLWAPTVYLVPRADGRLLIGGTVEECGFDDTMTAGGVYALLEAAWRAVPAIEDLPIDEMWVGFRPGSRDDAPILGESDVTDLWFATGHHRNGILLAPLTAQAVSRELLSGETVAALDRFRPGRFAGQIPGRRRVAS
jgi:glycine oxidase